MVESYNRRVVVIVKLDRINLILLVCVLNIRLAYLIFKRVSNADYVFHGCGTNAHFDISFYYLNLMIT